MCGLVFGVVELGGYRFVSGHEQFRGMEWLLLLHNPLVLPILVTLKYNEKEMNKIFYYESIRNLKFMFNITQSVV